MTAAITVRELGKCYEVDHLKNRGGYRTLRESLSQGVSFSMSRLRAKGSAKATEEFWALRNINFEAELGEVVGIIGRNGAGKSTLLKILSRITKPTTGSAELKGRVGSLLEVGTGFHPELTGRENIFLNGAILGIRRAQIAAMFDEIVDFAGVEKFLDTPVKRYSSGMYVRLAFAVAAVLETDILMVDEVLAVGDAEFQKKCLGRMRDLSRSGRTVFFVSHSMPAVRSLTRRCLYLQDGRVVFDGPTPEAIDTYLSNAWSGPSDRNGKALDYYRRDRLHNSAVRISRVWFTDDHGSEFETLGQAENFTVHCEIESSSYKGILILSYSLSNQNGERIATFYNRDQGFEIEVKPGRAVVSSKVQRLPLSPGRYNILIGIGQNALTTAFDVLVDYPAFLVEMPEIESGELDWPHRPWGGVHWRDVQWSATGDTVK